MLQGHHNLVMSWKRCRKTIPKKKISPNSNPIFNSAPKREYNNQPDAGGTLVMRSICTPQCIIWCENECMAALLFIPAHFELESRLSVNSTLTGWAQYNKLGWNIQIQCKCCEIGEARLGIAVPTRIHFGLGFEHKELVCKCPRPKWYKRYLSLFCGRVLRLD